jgi:Flp pilus assembly protein TadG
MSALTRQIRRFRDQEDGLVMTEFLIMLPLLVWTFMALFIYWDAFRTINQAQKAAYSVSDVISRQSEIDTVFIDGMQTIAEYLTNESSNVKLRITSVEFDEDDDEHRVLFSRSPGNKMPQLNDAALVALKDRIPLMADNDSVVIVETEVAYDPGFEVGIPNHSFDNFIVTRPRYFRRVCLTSDPCPDEL